MNYEEAIEAEDITRAEAKADIDLHGCGKEESWNSFLEHAGDKPEYTGQEVWGWLGY